MILITFYQNFNIVSRKNFGTEHCLLLMIGKCEKALGNKKAFRAILTDLAKSFYCICHNLLVAKLYAYGLTFPALKVMQDFLRCYNQRAKSGMSYSIWEKSLSDVPQGSVLGLLLFNNFLCDLSLSNRTVIIPPNMQMILHLTL